MPAVSILIKPVSSNCNLRCKYCFYCSLAERREIYSYGVMEHGTMENIIKKAFENAEGSCTFAFQGGEPTLAGIEFYNKFIELVGYYNEQNIKVNYSIQTNGIVIDEKWAELFARNKFLVGISLDGPKEIHNYYRVDGKEKSTFNKVMKSIELFNRFKVEYNILSVVTPMSVRYVDKTYNFFKKNNFKFIQFIPCLDPLGEERGKEGYSLKPSELEKFLKRVFDRWYEDFTKGQYVSIRYFDNILGIILGHMPESCSMNGKCQCQLVIEADGGVYPCDFYVIDRWKLGNINDQKINEILQNKKVGEFIKTSLPVDKECTKCPWYSLCRGGCRRERASLDGIGITLNYQCSAYKGFFDYTYSRFVKVAKALYGQTIVYP